MWNTWKIYYCVQIINIKYRDDLKFLYYYLFFEAIYEDH